MTPCPYGFSVFTGSILYFCKVDIAKVPQSLCHLLFIKYFCAKFKNDILIGTMNWLESLLWDSSSVAHIVCLYAFVISVGVLLGKIKIFGVSLGVTFVLFAGILMGHFGFTGETHILHFIREFGLILFVFCIGLQVGPSFFLPLRKGVCG